MSLNGKILTYIKTMILVSFVTSYYAFSTVKNAEFLIHKEYQGIHYQTFGVFCDSSQNEASIKSVLTKKEIISVELLEQDSNYYKFNLVSKKSLEPLEIRYLLNSINTEIDLRYLKNLPSNIKQEIAENIKKLSNHFWHEE